MKLTIYGSGYVGLVTGACLADVGNHVLCVDIDKQKVDALNRGEVPIYEPGLDELIASAREHGTLRFTTDPDEAVGHAQVQFIAVGTPPDEDGSADVSAVLAVAKTIAERMDERKVIVDKSTVPVGTGDAVRSTVEKVLKQRGENHPVDVVSNPEFLKEGAAISDFMKPDRIVVGTESDHAAEIMGQIYAPFCRQHNRVMLMDVRSAELTKYAANAMLATKISFMNELSQLAEKVGADIELVRQGIGSDPRIGFHFIYPGAGYGGSCFPKDVKALKSTAESNGIDPVVLTAVEERNERQKTVLFEKIKAHYNGKLRGKQIAVWGLAFKPNTDDMREAPSRVLMEALWDAGATVKAYDPEAADECRRIYGERSDFELVDEPMQAVRGADALVICTEWKLFRSPDFAAIAAALSDKVVFDGRNMYDPETVAGAGLRYYAIGRPTS